MTEVLKAGVLSDEIDLGALAHNAAEQAEEFVRKVSFVFWCQVCLPACDAHGHDYILARPNSIEKGWNDDMVLDKIYDDVEIEKIY